jgi:DNA-binding MarR family transcriptional regulator
MATTEREREGVPDVAAGELVAYVDRALLGEQVDDLESFTQRKQALAHPVRYAVLYYMYEVAGDDDERRIPRADIAHGLDREDNALETHLRPLLQANLIAKVPAPDGADGRKTFYRLTYLGRREVESDVANLEHDL